MNDKIKQFIEENIDLIEQNTKESWKEIYKKVVPDGFTETLLDARLNDPAEILGYIPKYYFIGTDIKNYTIPNNVTSIGGSAFEDCSSLINIEIPNSVISIDSFAFYKCSSLNSLEIRNSVTSIDSYAFAYCSSLTSVVIGDSVMEIGSYAFEKCSGLTNVVIPDSIKQINYGLFCDCYSLTHVEIPDSVKSIRDDAFKGCTNLKEIQFKGTKQQAMQIGIGNRSRKKWRTNSAIEKIVCTDGIINLN